MWPSVSILPCFRRQTADGGSAPTHHTRCASANLKYVTLLGGRDISLSPWSITSPIKLSPRWPRPRRPSLAATMFHRLPIVSRNSEHYSWQRRATKIHPVFALGEERRMEEYIRNAGGRCGQRIRDDRQYHRTRASAQRRRSKTNGEDQAIRRSKGGLSTKIHAMVDALGNPLAFFLTAGQAHDLQRCRRVSTPDAGRHLVGRCR